MACFVIAFSHFWMAILYLTMAHKMSSCVNPQELGAVPRFACVFSLVVFVCFVLFVFCLVVLVFLFCFRLMGPLAGLCTGP